LYLIVVSSAQNRKRIHNQPLCHTVRRSSGEYSVKIYSKTPKPDNFASNGASSAKNSNELQPPVATAADAAADCCCLLICPEGRRSPELFLAWPWWAWHHRLCL